jgi:hypothetical protein
VLRHLSIRVRAENALAHNTVGVTERTRGQQDRHVVCMCVCVYSCQSKLALNRKGHTYMAGGIADREGLSGT